MTRRTCAVLFAVVLTCGACERGFTPAQAEPPVTSPAAIVDFDRLYGSNCAGCHGARGEGGVALALANPAYMAMADDAWLRRVAAGGIPGTGMPAFGSSAGGLLTPEQIEALVVGMRSRWGSQPRGHLVPPPPVEDVGRGDSSRGALVFARACAQCHGQDGRGGAGVGSIVDPAYLTLVSDRNLRTTVVAGRPDLKHPAREHLAGPPLTDGAVADVVAWLAAHRSPPDRSPSDRQAGAGQP